MATTLAQYVGAKDGRDEEFIKECEAEATEMVQNHVRNNIRPDVELPPVIRARAIREVGADLFFRRNARNGVAGFDGAEGSQPVRIARDPMAAAYATLRPYMKPGIA
jgi:hypothetical protein